MYKWAPSSGVLLLHLLAAYQTNGQSVFLSTSFTTEVILTTETIFGTVTLNCNNVPIGTLAPSNNTNTESTGAATATVVETVSADILTRTQTVLSTTTITRSATTILGGATDIAISAGVPFTLNIFGPNDISLAAVIDSTGAVELVDASTAGSDATPVYIDDLGFIRLLNSQDDVLYFPDLTFPKLFKRQSTNGKAATKPDSQLTDSDTAGNFSASVTNIILRHEDIEIGLFFNSPTSSRSLGKRQSGGRGLYAVPSGQKPASTLTSGTVKGSVVSTSVSATKGISTAAGNATATGIDAIITSYSSFCQAYLSLTATTTVGSSTTVASTTLVSTNFSNTTVSSPGPPETTEVKTPETTVSTVGTFEGWSTPPSGQHRQKRQSTSSTATSPSSSSASSTSSNSTMSTTATSSTLTIPQALQTYASSVISSACKARITYNSLASTSLIYISEGTETTTTDAGETSTIYGPASSTITQTAGGTTVPVIATIVATAVPQPTPLSICRIGTGSNICLDLIYTQTTNSSTDPLRVWFSETSRDLITDIPLFTLDEYGRLTYTHPATKIKLYAALPKGNPTEGTALTFVTPQFKIANSYGYVKWYWDSKNNDMLILDPDNSDIVNSGETPPNGVGNCFYNSPAPNPAPQGSYLAIGPASKDVYNINTSVVSCFLGLTYEFRA
ncbi:hypothetical protein TWF718_009117 [Orbilia javanica]|uniref:Uncharacterized protein n=1 Tax=Orbilia javanica TaxID=47235 RepID=A0AAN8RGS8_9PEZI